MKEHKGGITCICVKSDDKECISSAGDGSCIVWDLEYVLCINLTSCLISCFQTIFLYSLHFQAICTVTN